MTTRRLARTLLTAVLASAALVSAGCGQEEVVAEADTEGIWVDAGALDYHIQGSRVLNPAEIPDRAYLQGLPNGSTQPTANEVWFAVFLRIENKTDGAQRTAPGFHIEDTEGDRFSPYGLDAGSNPFAYQPVTLGPKEAVPFPDSPQDFDSFSGAEVLFKLPLDSYQNRPLELIITSGGGEGPEEARVSLDV